MVAHEAHEGVGTHARAPADGQTLDIVLYSSLTDTAAQARKVSWLELREWLSTHQERATKGGSLWSAVRLLDGKATRANDNVDAVTGVVFDYDHCAPQWGLLDGLEYIAYTTPSHHADDPDCKRPDCPHWRVVILLSAEVAGTGWEAFWQRATFWLAPNVDESCKDSSRAYYPAICKPGAVRETRRGEGVPLDPESLPAVPDEDLFQHPPKGFVFTATDEPGERPGDRFTRETDWAEILEPAGGALVATVGETRRWRRPDKRNGWSATSGGGGHDVLYMFSSNWAPFKPRTSYTKFRAYSMLEYSGDDKAAARALAKRYGMDKQTEATVEDDGRQTGHHHAPGSPGANGVHAAEETARGLPEIDANELDLRIITRQAWEAVKLANGREPFLYRHGGIASRIEPDDQGRPVLRELTPDRVRHELARAAEFYITKISTTKDAAGNEKQARSRKVVLPPTHVARDMLATKDPPLPVVTRITEMPTFAPDGTLQATRGYHAAGKVYCALPRGFTLPPIPSQPSAEDLARAKTLILEEVMGEFPFVDQADRANAAGLSLLPYVRDMIPDPTPGHMVEGPIPGSGKGLLVHALLRPSCGRGVGAIAQAKDDDEWRKRITSMLRDGHSAILLDNLNRPLDSGALAMALTIPDWTDRVLGKTETVRIPVRCTWVATANNPTMSTEIARRFIRIRMDPRVDRPWEREGFKHQELLAWVDDHRAELVWASLVLVQAWIAAGRPKFSGRPLGSYEQWSRVIGGILEHAEIPGFLGNLSEFYEQADLEGAVWRDLVGAWWEKHHENEVGVADLFLIALGTEGLDLAGKTERAQKIAFGKALGKQRDRVIGEYRVVNVGTHNRAGRWRLLPTSGMFE
jgi:hypothetical protein